MKKYKFLHEKILKKFFGAQKKIVKNKRDIQNYGELKKLDDEQVGKILNVSGLSAFFV